MIPALILFFLALAAFAWWHRRVIRDLRGAFHTLEAGLYREIDDLKAQVQKLVSPPSPPK
jgi:hypothetical protein